MKLFPLLGKTHPEEPLDVESRAGAPNESEGNLQECDDAPMEPEAMEVDRHDSGCDQDYDGQQGHHHPAGRPQARKADPGDDPGPHDEKQVRPPACLEQPVAGEVIGQRIGLEFHAAHQGQVAARVETVEGRREEVGPGDCADDSGLAADHHDLVPEKSRRGAIEDISGSAGENGG